MLLLLELPLCAIFYVAQVKGNCMVVDWDAFPAGQGAILTTIFCLAIRLIQLLVCYRSEMSNTKWQRRSSIFGAMVFYSFMTFMLLSFKIYQIGFVNWHLYDQELSERPVFITQQVLPVCYDVTRKVAPVDGVDYILSPPSSINDKENQKNLGSVTFSCCRIWQRAYVGTLREIAETPGGITRRVKCQDAFEFPEYLVPLADLPLLKTHHCTLVVRMSYERSVGSLLYNTGIEYRNMGNVDECVTGKTNLKYSVEEHEKISV